MAGAKSFLGVLDAKSLGDAILVYIRSPFLISLLALATFYHILAPLFPTVKQKSWILTAFTSAVMSLASLPFLWDYLVGGCSVKNVRMSSTFTVIIVRYFQAHLAADLTLGAIYYRSRLSLLEGWIHHLIYIGVVEVTIRRSWTPIFCLCASMEIPTFVLGFSTLYPRFRSNTFFAVTFFMTRILLHIVLGISYLLQENRIHATGGSFLPATILVVILPLHVSWFLGCVKGFIRRAAQVQTQQPIPVVVPDTRTITTSQVLTVHNVEPSGRARFSRRVPMRLRNFLPLKLLHRRQSFERILRPFRPATRSAREWLVACSIYALLPSRESVFHYVGLGQERGQVPLIPALEKGEGALAARITT